MSVALGLAAVLVTIFVAGFSLGRLLGLSGEWTRLGARYYLLGLGALSGQGFCYGLVGLRLDLWGWLGPWWVLLAGVVWWRRQGAERPVGRPPAPAADRVVLVVVAVLGAASLAVALAHPINTADAANIYGINARQIASHRIFDADLLAELHTAGHIEYPPLVALAEALIFIATGPAGLRAVLVLFVLFFMAYALLMHELAREWLTPWWAAGAALLVVLSPEVLLYAWRGFADLPLTAYLSAALLHGLRCLRGVRRRDGFATVLFLLMAALTKNEGLAVAAPFGAALALVLLWQRRTRLAALLAGVLLAGLAPWPLYRMTHGLRLVDLEEAGPAGLIAHPERLLVVIREVFAVTARRGLHGDFMWGVFWPFLGVVMVLAVLRSVIGGRRDGWRLALPVVLLTAHLAIYTLVLAMTAADLRWHLETALSRMMLHVTPAALLGLAGSLRLLLGIPEGRRRAPEGRPAGAAPRVRGAGSGFGEVCESE